MSMITEQKTTTFTVTITPQQLNAGTTRTVLDETLRQLGIDGFVSDINQVNDREVQVTINQQVIGQA